MLALLAAALVLLPALVLRFWTASPLWLDEAQSVAIAAQPLPELFEALRRDGAPPLYYLLLHGWVGIFGTGDLAVRSLSGVVSVLSLPLAWWAGVRVGGTRRHGAFALLVLAASPWALRYATEARMYSLVLLLVLVAAVALDAVLRHGGVREVLALGTAAGLLALTHYWSFFLLAVVGALLLRAAMRGADPALRRGARLALVGLVSGAVLFLPWWPSFLFQVRYTGAPWADLPGLSRLAMLPVDWAGGTSPPGRWLLLVLWPLLLLGATTRASSATRAGTRRLRFSGEGAGRVAPVASLASAPSVAPHGVSGRLLAAVGAATLVVALLVSRLTGSGLEVRYTAIVVPGVVLLNVLGLFALPRRYRTAALVAVVALGLAAGWDAARTPRTQAGQIATALNDRASAGDVVIYCPDQLAPSVDRLLRVDGLLRTTVPRAREVAPVNWVDYERRTDETLGDSVASTAFLRAGESDGSVWLLTSPRYRTHQETCGEVREGLRRRGARARVVVPIDLAAYEYALLERWTPTRS